MLIANVSMSITVVSALSSNSDVRIDSAPTATGSSAATSPRKIRKESRRSSGSA